MTARLRLSSHRANGTLMARRGFDYIGGRSGQLPTLGLSWGFVVERATGIEPA
jgi:hypothetical protein